MGKWSSRTLVIFLILAVALPALAGGKKNKEAVVDDAHLRVDGEKHLNHIQQLTFGGENAECYWSWGQDRLIFQSSHGEFACDQIFTMNTDGSDVKLVSTGRGKTTCSYFTVGDKRILYASTHHYMDECPPPPDFSKGYVWKLNPEFDLFSSKPDGSDLKQLTYAWGYDAEAIVGPHGRIVFTSKMAGDLDIYTMDADGGNLTRLTDRLGYDGGPWWSPDGSQIVWRAYYPQKEEEIAGYRKLLADNEISPMALQLWVMDADGSNKRQVTDNGAANFGPYFHPDGKRIIYCSNQGDPQGRNFDLWIIGTDGLNDEQVTFGGTFDGFPMFNKKGTKLVFASNRNNAKRGDTNIFIADWVE